ncbi:MAG: lectin-like domain-containing protein, partial [Planctomycetaceae bacterium]
VTSPFQVNFTYTGQTTGDEGIAFVVQNDPQGLAALGSAGTGLGYAGIQNSLALLLDMGAGNGTALATGGEIPLLGSTGAINLQSGHPIAVSLVFDPVRNLLVQTLTDTVTSQTFTQTYSQTNLAGLLNGTSAWVGFTAGTSANGANQTVSNFSIVTLPAAAPIVLSAQGSIVASSSSSLIQGNVLSLQAGQQSVTGNLGTATTPLPIQLTPTTWLGNSYPGSVSATAPQDIHLVAPTGNIVVGSIVSPMGTVALQ